MQGGLLSILLFTRKANHTANVVLGAGMLALSIDVFHSAYIIFHYYEDFIHFAGVTYAFSFLYGPIFYLYARLISSGDDSFNKKYYLHFIPFVIVILYGLLFVYSLSSEFKFALIRGELNPHPFGIIIFNYLKPVHGLIYVFLTIKVVRSYNKKIANTFSNIEKINLDWLRHLAAGLIFVWGIVVISYIANAFSSKNINLDHFIYLAASLLIYSIGYFSLRQPQIFHPAEAIVVKDDDETIKEKAAKEGGVYRKSGLAENEAKEYLDKLLSIMEKEKPYLNSELTLRDLAEKLSISTHNLSEILNTRLNQNFYDFVNRYRVEEVKRKLAEGESEKFNLIAIAFDSGFNSKSAFNTIFKKHTGVTPSAYRKQIGGGVE